MEKYIGKNINKNLRSKYNQKTLDYAKPFPTDALKTGFKKAIEKTAEATINLIESKIVNKITRVSKPSK